MVGNDEETHVIAYCVKSYPEEILDVDGYFIKLRKGKMVWMTKKTYKILKELGYVS